MKKRGGHLNYFEIEDSRQKITGRLNSSRSQQQESENGKPRGLRLMIELGMKLGES